MTGLGVGPGVGDSDNPTIVGTGDTGLDTGLGVGFSLGDILLVGASDSPGPFDVGTGDTAPDPAVGLGVGFSLGDVLLVGAVDVKDPVEVGDTGAGVGTGVIALLEITNNIVNMKEYMVAN